MRSFVRSILQGEQLGVSIGQILRNLAAEMRKRRRAAAEERAQKAPIKMLFPLVFLIFPSLFIVLLYPALHEIVEGARMAGAGTAGLHLPAGRARPSATGDGLVVDPVCGRALLTGAVAGRLLHGGRHHYFCSLGCAERFAAEPRGFDAA